jgi:hypothetical protein
VEELDMFGDDEEVLQLFQEESFWAAANSTPKEAVIQIKRGHEEAKVEKAATVEIIDLDKDLQDRIEIMEDIPSTLNMPDVPDVNLIRKDLGKDLEVMNDNQLEDIPDALPDVPDFDMNELPIFSKEATKQSMDGNLVERKIVAISKANNLNTIVYIDISTPSLQIDASTQNSNSLDTLEKSPGPSLAVVIERPTPKVSLRQRNAIQLHPFTLEKERYQKLLSKFKHTLVDTNLTQMDDDAKDTQFTTSNTQLADISTDEIQTSQYIPPRRKETKQKQKNHRVSTPSKSNKHRSTIRPNPSTSNLEGMPTSETSSLEKYGLPELVIPIENKEPESKKSGIITFAKRKGSKKKRSTARKPTRFSEPVNKDIFTFDMHPRANFNLRTEASSIDSASSNTRTNDSMDTSTARKTGTRTIWDLTSTNDKDESSSILNNDSFSFDDNVLDYDMDIEHSEIEDDEMEVETPQLNFSTRLRNKRHLGLDSSDEEDDDAGSIMDDDPVIPTPTEEELDALFEFPTETTLVNAVPVVRDKLEYRETKRQRMTLQSLMKNRKALKGVLPASFLKIYASQIEDEMKSRKRAKPSKSTTSKFTTQSNTRAKERGTRNIEDIFASFRESESENDAEDSEDASDAYSTMDDYVERLDSQISLNSGNSNTFRIPAKYSNVSHTNIFSGNRTQSSNSQNSTQRFIQSTLQTVPINQSCRSPLVYNTNSIPSQYEQNINSMKSPSIARDKLSNHQSKLQDYTHLYPLEESTEDNRVNALYNQPKPNSAIKTSSVKRSVSKSNSNGRRKTPKSSIAIGNPLKDHDLKYSFQIRDNATPQRRRKRPKRPRDDIYIHAPTFTWYKHDRSGQTPDNTIRTFIRESNSPLRKAFDDIYVGTRQSARYGTREFRDIRQDHDQDNLNNETEDYSNDQRHFFNESLGFHDIHSLHNVIKRIRNMHDHDLRRIRGLGDTVYIHHRLLQPLMSENPNLKSAYQHFQQEFEDLYLFGRHYTWQNINYDEKGIIDFLFSKATQDIYHACVYRQEKEHEITDIPHHDHFYTFVSICLTQWIPCHPYKERVQLVDLFLEHIRSLTGLIPKLVEDTRLDTPWKPIIKLLLFILDWTCRLHHLGIHPLDWAVTDCTRYLMDILVFIGYEDIQSTTNCKEYIVEAWICLIQIMTVSSNGCGYYFHERIFVNQLTDSIKRKSKASSSYEYEKRKTTRLWAETLNRILDKHILQ